MLLDSHFLLTNQMEQCFKIIPEKTNVGGEDISIIRTLYLHTSVQ